VAIEFFGSGLQNMSCAGQAEMCQMAMSLGAYSATTQYSQRTFDFLVSTHRHGEAAVAEEFKSLLSADLGVEYEELVEVDLSHVDPVVWGPAGRSSRMWSTSQLAQGDPEARPVWPTDITGARLEGCEYESITRSAGVLRNATKRGISLQAPLCLVLPSAALYDTLLREDFLKDFERAGASVSVAEESGSAGEARTPTACTVSSGPQSLNTEAEGGVHFVAAPSVVTALALAGSLEFDPQADCFLDDDSNPFCLEPPAGDHLPEQPFTFQPALYQAPPTHEIKHDKAADEEESLDSPSSSLPSSGRLHAVDPESAHLQLLKTTSPPFPVSGVEAAQVLVTVVGDCGVDVLLSGPSTQGGDGGAHIDRLSAGLLRSCVLSEDGEIYVHQAARLLQEAGVRWVVVGGAHFGSGCGVENTALVIRHLGGCAVVAGSFSPAFETELKMQGLLPLTFMNPEDAQLVTRMDSLTIPGLDSLSTGVPVLIQGASENGNTYSFHAQHSLTLTQIEWIRSAGALNMAMS